jgi:hypothetical protein
VTEPTTPEGMPTPGDGVLNRISTATAALDGIEQLPLAEAAARFEALHGEVQAALADLDQN